MKLVSKSIKPWYTCWVYHDAVCQVWLKRVTGIDFDIESFLEFNDRYNVVHTPISISYESKILEYEMEDISKYQSFKCNNNIEIFNCFQDIVHFFRCFNEYSKDRTNIFYHADMTKANMIYKDGTVKLIDIDSFLWNTPERYRHYMMDKIKLSWQTIALEQHLDWDKLTNQFSFK